MQCGHQPAHARERDRESRGVGYMTSIGLSLSPPSLFLGSRGFYQQGFFCCVGTGREGLAKFRTCSSAPGWAARKKKPAVPDSLPLNFCRVRIGCAAFFAHPIGAGGCGGALRVLERGKAKAVKEGWRAGWGCQMRETRMST